MRRQAVISSVQYFEMARAFWTLPSNLFGELLVFCFDSHQINQMVAQLLIIIIIIIVIIFAVVYTFFYSFNIVFISLFFRVLLGLYKIN